MTRWASMAYIALAVTVGGLMVSQAAHAEWRAYVSYVHGSNWWAGDNLDWDNGRDETKVDSVGLGIRHDRPRWFVDIKAHESIEHSGNTWQDGGSPIFYGEAGWYFWRSGR